MKLSDKQKEVIKKMREGWTNEIGFLHHKDHKGNSKIVDMNTHQALKRKELILYTGSDNIYELTELGKSITL